MEEDIENVKFIIRDLKADCYNKRLIGSLENLLTRYKQLKEENKELLEVRISANAHNRIMELEEQIKKFYEGEIFTAKQLKNIEQNQKKYFINKQIVKEKIEELEGELTNEITRNDGFSEYREYAIEVLKDVLEEE